MVVLLFLAAIVLIGAPIAMNAIGMEISSVSQILMTGAGIFLLLVGSIIVVVTKLYQRARANEAFVRTGMGGVRIIRDGGALVIPVIHEFLKISLQTLKLEVVREHSEALITQDNLRADIGAEFFVRVEPNDESILQAARSLGDKMMDVVQVRTAVEDKLISALRAVAATKTLTQLHTDREGFVEEVTKAVNNDLKENGLTLESVTISKLDQTSVSSLKDDNVFDAQGKRTIAEITQKNMTETNRLQRAGEQARKEQDVETEKAVLTLDQEKKNAEARQRAEIAKVEAEQQREATEKSIEAQKAIELAEVEKQQRVAVAGIEKDKAANIANEAKLTAIALASSEKATQEAELAKAQAMRESEMQKIKTVEIEAAANRDKAKSVIEAQAQAEQNYVVAQRQADAQAYQVQKDAEARKAAADADAEATTKKAAAEASALKARADGDQAVQMVPVQVERERVKIDQDRIEHVVKPELEAREKSGKVAQDFEIAKLKVEAEMQVQIETARAMASIGSKVQMNLYGTPENAADMLNGIVKGQNWAESINAFKNTIDPSIIEAARDAAEGAASMLGGSPRKIDDEGSERPSEGSDKKSEDKK